MAQKTEADLFANNALLALLVAMALTMVAAIIVANISSASAE